MPHAVRALKFARDFDSCDGLRETNFSRGPSETRSVYKGCLLCENMTRVNTIFVFKHYICVGFDLVSESVCVLPLHMFLQAGE